MATRFANVDYNQVLEHAPHQFSAEASELGFERLPVVIHTKMGNGNDFIAMGEETNDDGDLLYVLYQQEYGAIQLKVFND